MGALDLRAGFRFAGIKSQLEFLAGKEFTGEICYRQEGSELRSDLTAINFGEDSARESGAVERIRGRFEKDICEWCLNGAKPLKVFFRGGILKRTES